MVEFAQRGLEAVAAATRLAMDYFALKEEDFLSRWLPGRGREIERETTAASWRAIVESLNNPVQQRIVADDREQTNVLVLAAPAPARPGCWSTVLPIWSGHGARRPGASWPWPTTAMRRWISGAASES